MLSFFLAAVFDFLEVRLQDALSDQLTTVSASVAAWVVSPDTAGGSPREP
jgi:hypothetical protein